MFRTRAISSLGTVLPESFNDPRVLMPWRFRSGMLKIRVKTGHKPSSAEIAPCVRMQAFANAAARSV
jgi:hypothetical protein